MPFHLANVVKYIVRVNYYRHKFLSLEEKERLSKALDKAEWYLKRWRQIAGL